MAFKKTRQQADIGMNVDNNKKYLSPVMSVAVRLGGWLPELAAYLRGLCRQKALCDLRIITADGHTLHAHKCIVYAILPYLAKLECKQDGCSEIRTEDVTMEMWSLLLEYCYTGFISDVSLADVIQLNRLSAVWRAQPLQEMCSLALSNHSRCLISEGGVRRWERDIKNYLVEQYKGKSDADAVIIVRGGTPLPIHSYVVLAAVPSLRSLISSETGELVSPKIDLHCVDPETMREIVRVCYTGETRPLKEEEILTMAEACEKLLADKIKVHCGLAWRELKTKMTIISPDSDDSENSEQIYVMMECESGTDSDSDPNQQPSADDDKSPRPEKTPDNDKSRSTENTADNSCRFCLKLFASAFNVRRHEKNCSSHRKSATNGTVLSNGLITASNTEEPPRSKRKKHLRARSPHYSGDESDSSCADLVIQPLSPVPENHTKNSSVKLLLDKRKRLCVGSEILSTEPAGKVRREPDESFPGSEKDKVVKIEQDSTKENADILQCAENHQQNFRLAVDVEIHAPPPMSDDEYVESNYKVPSNQDIPVKNNRVLKNQQLPVDNNKVLGNQQLPVENNKGLSNQKVDDGETLSFAPNIPYRDFLQNLCDANEKRLDSPEKRLASPEKRLDSPEKRLASPSKRSTSCQFCEKVLSGTWNVRWHENMCPLRYNVKSMTTAGTSQGSSDTMRCQYCAKVFSCTTKRRQHEKLCSTRPETKSRTTGSKEDMGCHICSKSFYDAHNRRRHEKRCPLGHGDSIDDSIDKKLDTDANENEASCSFCSKVFSCPKNKWQHELVCSLQTETEFQTFGTDQEMQDIPSRICKFCAQVFYPVNNRRQHEKTCPFRPGYKSTTTNRESVNEKNCEFCLKVFYDAKNRRRHEKTCPLRHKSESDTVEANSESLQHPHRIVKEQEPRNGDSVYHPQLRKRPSRGSNQQYFLSGDDSDRIDTSAESDSDGGSDNEGGRPELPLLPVQFPLGLRLTEADAPATAHKSQGQEQVKIKSEIKGSSNSGKSRKSPRKSEPTAEAGEVASGTPNKEQQAQYALLKLYISCLMCEAVLHSEGEYSTHLTDQHPQHASEFECKVCERPHRGMNAETIVKHTLTAVSSQALQCHLCATGRFTRRAAYWRHLMETHPDHPDMLQCYVCHGERNITGEENATRGRIRGWIKQLINHRGRHFPPPTQYGCVRCQDRKYTLKKTALVHIRNAHPTTPLTCPVCNKTFTRRPALRHHMRTTHLDDPQSPEVCSLCDREYEDREDYRRHMQEEHNITGPCDYRCGKCDAVFALRSEYYLHRKTQHDRRLMCDVCGKVCLTSQILLDHINVRHSGAIQYSCIKCGKKCTSKRSLVEHQRSCGKVIECELCGKTLNSYKTLSQHLKTHAPRPAPRQPPPRPHACGTCGKGFTQSNALADHRLTHTGVAKLPHQLRAHMARVHSGKDSSQTKKRKKNSSAEKVKKESDSD